MWCTYSEEAALPGRGGGLGVLPKLEPAANCDLCDEAGGRMKKALSPSPAFQHLSRAPW